MASNGGDGDPRYPPKGCAACRFRRRKCTSRCVFAPYFPFDQPKNFENVHRLFGCNKVVKMLNKVHPSLHKELMDSIIFEANARETFPVTGSLEYIYRLQLQLYSAQQALNVVQQQLETYRQYHASSSSSMINNDVTYSQLQSGIPMMTPPNVNHAFPLLLNHNNGTVVAYDNSMEQSVQAASSSSSMINNDVTYSQFQSGIPMMTPPNVNHAFPLLLNHNNGTVVAYDNSMEQSMQAKDHEVFAPSSSSWGANHQNPCQDGGGDSMHSQSQLVSTSSQTLDIKQKGVLEYNSDDSSYSF